jgi:DNA gyrase subunit B
MTDYSSSNIKVLKGLDAVKKRPGMYIGNTDDGTGLHHMIFEVLDNSLDENMAGYCDHIYITLYKDGSIAVKDNGRGIPIDLHKEEGKPAAEIVLTVLHAGGKFDQDSYDISGGLHGVGVSVVNALSDWLELIVIRDGKKYYQKFEEGIASAPTIFKKKEDEERGTHIRFIPSKKYFTNCKFDQSIIKNKLKEISYLNPKLHLHFFNEENKENILFFSENGLIDFIKNIGCKQEEEIFTLPIKGIIENDKIAAVLQWSHKYSENYFCYTNNIIQIDGGTHLTGCKSGIFKAIMSYIDHKPKFHQWKNLLISEDTREGLIAILSILTPNPKFSSQTKNKLINNEIRSKVEKIIQENLFTFLLENPDIATKLLDHIIRSYQSRNAAKQARDLVRKTPKDSLLSKLPGKLAPCQQTDPAKSELFLVEGDSAGGSAKQGRNRLDQAILPLKGKILNVEKASNENIFNSEQILNVINALNINSVNEIKLEKVRYHKIIIMTDADVDGKHIRCLLLTLFYRFLQPLIMEGWLYIAQPPLYGIKVGRSKEIYIHDEKAMEKYLLNIASTNLVFSYGNKKVSSEELLFILDEQQHYEKIVNQLQHVLPQNAVSFLLSSENWHNLTLLLDTLEQYLNKKSKKDHLAYHISDGYLISNHDQRKYSLPLILFQSEDWKRVHQYLNLYKKLFHSKTFSLTKGNITTQFHQINELIPLCLEQSKQNRVIKRYKGLGEMSPEQLWETTMNNETRTLIKVTIEDAFLASELFEILMGKEVEPRKNFIIQHSPYVNLLDL